VGFFSPRRPKIEIRRPPSWISEPPSRSEAWERKVRALAERSIDVAALLDFYEKLGQEAVMPHFDPERHTTNDVVRQAIIPLSRTDLSGVAYASLDDVVPKRTDPEKPQQIVMVTHSWSNLFLHLVAAVVADALGKDEYEAVAERLKTSEGRERLREQLAYKETLFQRYWICAFCVNQHASICGGFGSAPPVASPDFQRWDASRRDTVSKLPFQVCSCEEPKHFNDSGDECELNKFDDMMGLLHRELNCEVPRFRQIAAVDRNFEVFTRLWCIAEFVQAYMSGIPQKVCLLSNRAVDIDNDDLTLYTKMASLKASDCHATRPEDKEEILRKIPNLAEFDLQLQNAVFGERGLLRRSFLAFDLLDAAARSARRVYEARRDSLLADTKSNDHP
jgi:hypothetical protein